jgi:AAA15 family ATPase/GTPase
VFIEFSVENFRSIKDRVTLSLIAANLRARDPKLDSNNEIRITGMGVARVMFLKPLLLCVTSSTILHAKVKPMMIYQ